MLRRRRIGKFDITNAEQNERKRFKIERGKVKSNETRRRRDMENKTRWKKNKNCGKTRRELSRNYLSDMIVRKRKEKNFHDANLNVHVFRHCDDCL